MIRAQLIYWRLRLAFRRRRWHYWERHENPAEVAKWQKLSDEAHKHTEALEARLKHRPPPHPSGRFSMFDSEEVREFPPFPEAVAGYVNGKWPNYAELRKRFPNAKHLAIDVLNAGVGDCLDIENGDASPADAPGYVRTRQRHGIARPALYANLDTMPEVKAALAEAHIKREEVRLWVAHYTYIPHLPPGYDACQWTDKAIGRNLDRSLCEPGFLA